MSEEDFAALQANMRSGRAAPRPPKKRKRRVHHERKEQIALADYLDADPRFAGRWFHVPNGEHRNPVTGAILKAMGVKAGVPDIWILAPLMVDGERRPGVVIELKRCDGGTLSPAQRVWLDVAREAGFVLIDEGTGEDAGSVAGAAAAIDALRRLYK